MDKFEAEGDAPATLKKKQWLLDFANKELGKRPIAELKAPEILDALRKIEKRGKHETATRLRGTVGAVFRFCHRHGTSRAGSDGRAPRRPDHTNRYPPRNDRRAKRRGRPAPSHRWLRRSSGYQICPQAGLTGPCPTQWASEGRM